MPEDESPAPWPSSTIYHPDMAEIIEDGKIAIRAGGCDRHGIWDGYVTIEPSSPEYQFWLWTTEQTGRWERRSLCSENLLRVHGEYEFWRNSPEAAVRRAHPRYGRSRCDLRPDCPSTGSIKFMKPSLRQA
jgi:hypothetical protein